MLSTEMLCVYALINAAVIVFANCLTAVAYGVDLPEFIKKFATGLHTFAALAFAAVMLLILIGNIELCI